MPEMPDVITGETITSEWGNDIRDRTVQRYATTAERSSEHPSPVEGDLSYLEDTGTIELYDGTTWRPIGVQTSIRMDGATEVVLDSSLTGTFENGATVSFIKPAGWLTYDLMAWGAAAFRQGTTASQVEVRISIGASNGTARAFNLGGNASENSEVTAQHRTSSLSADATVAIQYRLSGANPIQGKQSSHISLIAIRQT